MLALFCELIALATGIWGHFSKKTWSCGRVAFIEAGFILVYCLVFVILIVVAMVLNKT